jgi:hypothetical protein
MEIDKLIINLTVYLSIIILFIILTPGILINDKYNKYANKYGITLLCAFIFGLGILLIYRIKNLKPIETEALSSCPAVPKCVNANYNNITWPWTGCAVNYTNKNGIVKSPQNWVHSAPDENNNVNDVKCPSANGKVMGAFPYLIVDLPGTPGQNAKPEKIDLNNPPCMYELDQMCGYANAYDRNGNVIVGTKKNPPKCGSKYDQPTPITQNKNIFACLSKYWYNLDMNSARNYSAATTVGNAQTPLFISE